MIWPVTLALAIAPLSGGVVWLDGRVRFLVLALGGAAFAVAAFAAIAGGALGWEGFEWLVRPRTEQRSSESPHRIRRGRPVPGRRPLLRSRSARPSRWWRRRQTARLRAVG